MSVQTIQSPPRTNILDANGRMAREWVMYFNALGVDVKAFDDRIEDLEMQLAMLGGDPFVSRRAQDG